MKPANCRNVLLVHNDPYALYMLKESLRMEGLNPVSAGSGEEGLRYLMKHRPDLISLDLAMPRRSGIMFYHALRRNKEWSRIPLLVVSGSKNGKTKNRNEEDIFEGRRVLGPSIYLEKPLRLEDYLDLIHQAMGVEPARALPPAEVEGVRRKIIETVLDASPEVLSRLDNYLRKNVFGKGNALDAEMRAIA